MGVHRQQGEPRVVGFRYGATGTVFVDVADLKFFEIAAEALADTVFTNRFCILGHMLSFV